MESETNLTADNLNDFFSKVSTDKNYTEILKKFTVSKLNNNHISDERIFGLLDKLRPTAAGPDGLPSWLLKLAAPCIAEPLAFLFNNSITCQTVPKQWKESTITPIPKVPTPQSEVDFRPLSVTSILSRTMEKIIVRDYIYPILEDPMVKKDLMDQFGFRPTGSPTAALICLTNIISKMLVDCPYFHVITLDISRAFDTLRHSTLLNKLAKMPFPDDIYNWLVDYFTNRCHKTKYCGFISELAYITASIIQGSGLGPICYILNSTDLHTKYLSNKSC